MAFNLDGVSLFYKRNPADQARAPKGHIWQKKCEGLSLGCTAKGSKEGSGGKVVEVEVDGCHKLRKGSVNVSSVSDKANI